MEMNDMVIVSVDDHIIEPPTMWDRHLPAKHRNIKPQWKERADGSQYWVMEGRILQNFGLCAAPKLLKRGTSDAGLKVLSNAGLTGIGSRGGCRCPA